MSAFLDAKRFLWLATTTDEATEHLRATIEHFEKYGFKNQVVDHVQRLQNIILEKDMQLTGTEVRLREAVQRANQLEEQLKEAHVKCHTHMSESLGSMSRKDPLTSSITPSPELEPDLLSDPNFIPCRDERCPIQTLHPQHSGSGKGRGPRRNTRRNTNA
jgi:hypothetical protein